MLVAHMDTVHKTQCDLSNIYISLDRNTIKSDVGIGGDDRCGIYMIMKILKETNLRPFVLFVEDEEIGGIGSGKFIKRYNKSNLKLNFIIELDRKGSNDSVYYDLDNEDFENYINKFGFKTDYGSFTDICNLCPAFNCAGVNLSCGYYNAHTTSEYVKIDEMENTINKVIDILSNALQEDYFEWKELQYNYKYGNYDYTYAYNDYYFPSTKKEYYSNQQGKLEIWDYCDYCGAKMTLEDVHQCDDGYNICEYCARQYGVNKCKDCGLVWTPNYDMCCSECKQYYRQLERNDV